MHIDTLLRHIYTLFRHIQHPVKPSLIHNLTIFCVLVYFEREAYLKPYDQAYSKPYHMVYSTIFRHIQNFVQRLLMQKPGILRILEYSELFHNCIPKHVENTVIRKFMNIQNSDILKTRNMFRNLSKMEFFVKIVKKYNYFSEELYLRSLTGFWIRRVLTKFLLKS